jgi:gamma-glutamyltranspeptidase/glutathione hydrolase
MRTAILLPFLAIFGLLSALVRAEDEVRSGDLVKCGHGAIVAVNREATRVGVDVLQRGGNAIDAAVATAFALAVTHPAAGNIGGGGYLIVVPPGEKALAFDFREVAPAAATKEMFVDPQQRTPHRRVGVPGTVRGLALAHNRLGRLPWRDLVAPAVKLAQEGFEFDAPGAQSLNEILIKSNKQQFAEFHRVYAKAEGTPWKPGDRLKLPDLGRTLQRIAEEGADGFYLGKTAELIAAEMRRGGGLVTKDDLAAYRPVVREPAQGSYRGCTICSSPPSSSGGTTLIETLNILECFDLRAHDRWSSQTLHLLIEASKRAYRDRAAHLADPDRVKLPPHLLAKEYAQKLATGIDLEKATPSTQLAGDIELARESEQTTHFSVLDRDRMAVSLTYTLENSYGSRVVVPGAGFLLNDEMNDFNWLPGVTDKTGRIGTESNQIEPGKRMLSSMTPTIVVRDGKPLLITGSPGGRTIINTVLQMTVNVVDYGMDLRSAVDAPRLHHQWLPDEVRLEPGLLEKHAETVAQLQKMGHVTKGPAVQGDAHSIWIDPKTGEITAAADKRISGSAAGY